MKVYLAGGMKSGWQDRAMSLLPTDGFEWLDPRSHGLEEVSAFTTWDLKAVEECDVLFGYWERFLPGGYALCLEIGYAKAMGKHIVLVDEQTKHDENHKHRVRMAHACCNAVYPDFMDGLQYLYNLRTMKETTK